MSNSNGCPTLGEKLETITASLKAQGIQAPQGFQVVFADGETILVVSPSNPALARTDEVTSVKPVSTARAGA